MTTSLPWLRLWDRTLDSSKTQRLSGETFKGWINLLCLANRQNDRGRLPGLDEIAFALRTSEKTISKLIDDLVKTGLIDQEGDTFRMHDWKEWQPNKKSNAQRAREWRQEQKQRALTERTPERSRARVEEEEEEETEEEGERTSARALVSPPPPIASLGPEYTALGEWAIQLGADVSWGTWVTRQGLAGHKVEDIRAALEQASGAGKLTQPYVASILRGWAVEGRPKSSGWGGRAPSKPPPPPVDPEKLKAVPIRINDRMSPKTKRISIEQNRANGFPDDGVIAS